MIQSQTPDEETPHSSALAHTSTHVPTALPGDTAGEVLRRLIGADRFDSVAGVAVLDADRLVGVIRIEELLAATDETPVSAVMDPDPPVIGPGTDQEAAASKAVMHEESSLGVVDSDGRFVGLIPPYRMLGVLLEEHREDLARISGYLHQSASARSASEERMLLRFWHRFPWLLVGLAAALAAAVIVAAFEAGLSSHVELAFFMPGIVYIADAVGNQTVTLVVRGLSVGVPVASVMRRELVTGIILGAVLAVLTFPVVTVWFDRPIGLTVAVAIWAASGVATGVAMSLPWLFSKLDIDPAFGSGPLATVVQDLLSISIYFAIATVVVL